jgi:flagellar biosynthesis protein FlhB
MMNAFANGFGFVLGLVVACGVVTVALALVDYALERFQRR